MIRLYRLLALAAWCACLAASAGAPQALYCPRADGPITLDGKLDDATWQSAPVRDLARLGDQAPLQPVQLRALWTADGLYLAFASCDQDVRTDQTTRDARLWETDDVVELFLSIPGMTGSIVELQLNPRNTQLDILHRPGASFAECVAWNWPGFVTAVHVDGTLNDGQRDAGWSAELYLPFAGLRDLGIAPPTAAAAPWRLFACSMNRIALSPERLSREKSFWPVPSADGLADDAEYARLYWIDQRPTTLCEGFARIVRGHSRRYDGLLRDHRGLSVPWEYDTTRADAVLSWETARLPNPLPDPVTLAFVGQIAQENGAANPDRAHFDLLLGDRPVLRFVPFQTADCAWQQDDVRLSFTLLPSPKPRSGLYRLQLPARLLTPGRPARLALRWAGDGPPTIFSLKAYTDAALCADRAR